MVTFHAGIEYFKITDTKSSELMVFFSLGTSCLVRKASFLRLRPSGDDRYPNTRNKIPSRFVRSPFSINKLDLPPYFAVNLARIYIKFDFSPPGLCERASDLVCSKPNHELKKTTCPGCSKANYTNPRLKFNRAFHLVRWRWF